MTILSTDIFQAVHDYLTWLETQPLSVNTRRTYSNQVNLYADYLLGKAEELPGHPLLEASARDYAVRDYKLYLKLSRRAKPNSVNMAIAALDHFYRFLGLGNVKVNRERLPHLAPRSLEIDEQHAFIRVVEQTNSPRDYALIYLFLYTGLRVGEVAQLDLDDVLLAEHNGTVIVRSGKGERYREVPANTLLRQVLKTWKRIRAELYPGATDPALFLSQRGCRLTTRAIHMIVQEMGRKAGLNISPHVLRHTCLTNLLRNGSDLVLVSDIAGHSTLETTRRYCLPSIRDRETAMESLITGL
jgi:site-specific recombinase XerD